MIVEPLIETAKLERRRAKHRLIQSIKRSGQNFPKRSRIKREGLTPIEVARRERNRIRQAQKRASSEEYREQNRIYSRAYAAEHKEERSRYAKNYRLQRHYGIGWAEFSAMLAEQNGKCAICDIAMTPPARASKHSIAVTVDHCHGTGKVRGLLCYSCNLGLGVFKDNLDRLRSAVGYLEKANLTK